MALEPQREAFLRSVAPLVWWKTPEEAILSPEYLVRQVMCLGTLAQLRDLEACYSPDELKTILKNATPGQLNGRSWHFWHYRLYGPDCTVPPMPQRPRPLD